MRREAHLRENEFVKGEWTDELVFAMLASEWPSRGTAGLA
jgi:RimJ/RimL family protein N-acetyltransferase